MFRHVVHCDWSLRAAGRWSAEARRQPGGGWLASGPAGVPDPAALVDRLVALGRQGALGGPGMLGGPGATLAAFDFPIGFPARFGAATGYADFPSALDAVAAGGWPEIFAVAATPAEVSPRRPFYPARPGGARLAHLLDGHGVADTAALVRACERPGAEGGAAGCMFWTLGAQQVGKAALHGWREVIGPARRAGARLWPFEGDLAALARPAHGGPGAGGPGAGGLVLAESYPGDGYGQLGFAIRRKGDRALRAALAPHLAGWAAERHIALDAGLSAALAEGFGPDQGGDDGFDAVVGLLAALAVADGERAPAPRLAEPQRRWEGWILGKRPAP